ncbi:hypothetical protein Celaphus_00001533 [Cervus elaphus hippelaphus]|uniref:Uncharacterized protein n=1 Tax=Cervus elaphus hippelaphus TaxID=46360 RepID=A0A212D7Q3_CEREH|nr:hypothetical protein Celaphus_00001533 [Cervus elaphus hippelaphus]
MKGSRALSGPEGSLEGVDLSLTGLPPPMNRRPNSASTTKPITRSISVVTGSEPRRKTLENPGPGGSRAINNLRRSNSATQVNQPQANQAWPSPLRGSPRQELQQKRAQKSGNADLGLLKATGETEKPQPTQEPAVRPGSTAQQTRKANNTGLLHVCKAPWWADAVFCCAGARFRTAGLEDAGQPALGSSPEPQQLSEDKPQAQQRDLTFRRVKETERELGRQLRQQKEHYEATIQRHLSFIDQEEDGAVF